MPIYNIQMFNHCVSGKKHKMETGPLVLVQVIYQTFKTRTKN